MWPQKCSPRSTKVNTNMHTLRHAAAAGQLGPYGQLNQEIKEGV